LVATEWRARSRIEWWRAPDLFFVRKGRKGRKESEVDWCGGNRGVATNPMHLMLSLRLLSFAFFAFFASFADKSLFVGAFEA